MEGREGKGGKKKVVCHSIFSFTATTPSVTIFKQRQFFTTTSITSIEMELGRSDITARRQ